MIMFFHHSFISVIMYSLYCCPDDRKGIKCKNKFLLFCLDWVIIVLGTESHRTPLSEQLKINIKAVTSSKHEIFILTNMNKVLFIPYTNSSQSSTCLSRSHHI